MPRSLIIRGVFDLIPRSTAATVNFFSPFASTTYASFVATSDASSEPSICGAFFTASSRSASLFAASAPENTPTRIAPRSRRWRVRARVSMSQIPTMPCSARSSSRVRTERQFDGRMAGSRTT